MFLIFIKLFINKLLVDITKYVITKDINVFCIIFKNFNILQKCLFLL